MFTGNVVGITVEHPVGEGPEVVGGEIDALPDSGAEMRAGAGPTDGTPLAHVMRVGLDRVGVEIEFADSGRDARSADVPSR
jgi:hypothetical protein